MAETAGTVIKSALQEILVQASEAPLEPAEVSDAITYLNRMMAKYSSMGISLGYTAVTAISDTITVNDGAIDGMVANLAVRMHPQFSAPGTPIPIALVQSAKDGLDVMRMIAIDSIGPTAYPDTLPIGSGNESRTFGCTNHFYSGDDEAVLTESGGFIATESKTEAP